MEMLFKETLDKHFYTNDRSNLTKKGHTESVDEASVLFEDVVSYVIKKYNFRTQQKL